MGTRPADEGWSGSVGSVLHRPAHAQSALLRRAGVGLHGLLLHLWRAGPRHLPAGAAALAVAAEDGPCDSPCRPTCRGQLGANPALDSKRLQIGVEITSHFADNKGS